MSNKKQTAVDWLLNNMPDLGRYIPFGVSMELHAKFQQAKEMEKEQMKKAFFVGDDSVFHGISDKNYTTFTEYYNDTYGK